MGPSCLTCHHSISPAFSWKKLLSFSIMQTDPLMPVEHWLCTHCRAKMIWLQEGCHLCSRSLQDLEAQYVSEYEGGMICYDCRRWLEWEEELDRGKILTWNRSIVQYNEWMQELLTQYKFRGDERLKYFLASVLLFHWEDLLHRNHPVQVDVISPIPLSAARLLERGFNQSALIAQLLAEKVGIAYAEDLLIRQDGEEKQSKKGRAARLQEMLQKFLNNPERSVDIHNKHILLIDDIYTTGATLFAAAYILKQQGAKRVYAYTIAR